MPSAETRFAARAMRYLLGPQGRSDTSFARCFWQYQRVRCRAYAFLIQEPGTPGLDWFRVHFGRLSAFRGPLESHLGSSALRHSGQGLELRVLEARVAPEPNWTRIRDAVRQLARSNVPDFPPRSNLGEWPRLPPARPEVGLIFHFIKEDTQRHPRKGRTLHADPSGNASGFRFGDWFLQRRRQALAISTALEHHPELLLVLRGLDVASSELATPTWVTMPLLRQTRMRSQQVAARLLRRQPRWQASALRLTLHAGEDYRRLVEGLRRLHELFEFGLLRTGDRIGHALALGESPEHYAAHHPLGVQPAEERLDDLLWELDRYGQGQLPAAPERMEQVRREALALARELYTSSREDLDTFLEARRLRHDEQVLAWLRFPDRIEPRRLRDRALRLVWRHLTDVNTFRRGQRPVEAHSHPGETAMLAEAQRWLRTLLREKEITLETNPSSNQLIQNAANLQEHPSRVLAPSLLLSVNSDDPVTFATSLADEYAYVASALVHAGESYQGALQSLDRLRENGWRSRFTLAASADPSSLQRLLRTP